MAKRKKKREVKPTIKDARQAHTLMMRYHTKDATKRGRDNQEVRKESFKEMPKLVKGVLARVAERAADGAHEEPFKFPDNTHQQNILLAAELYRLGFEVDLRYENNGYDSDCKANLLWVSWEEPS